MGTAMNSIAAGAIMLMVFGLIGLGIVWKPAIALMVSGMLLIFGGAFATGLVSPSVGIEAMIGGVVIIGLGQMVTIGQDAVAQLRGLRRDLLKETASKSSTLAPKPRPPIEVVQASRQLGPDLKGRSDRVG
jgi:hypothetical protein